MIPAWVQYQHLTALPVPAGHHLLRFYELARMIHTQLAQYGACAAAGRRYLALARRQQSPYAVQRATITWAGILHDQERYGRAEHWTHSVLQASGSAWADLRLRARAQVVVTALERGKFGLVNEALDRLAREPNAQQWPSHYAFAAYFRGYAQLCIGRLSEALDDLAVARTTYLQLGDERNGLWAHLRWLQAHLHQHNPLAHADLVQSIQMTRRGHLLRHVGGVRLLWGDIARQKEHPAVALHHYGAAVRLARRQELSLACAVALGRYAEVLLDLKQFHAARQYAHDATNALARAELGVLHAPRVWCIYAQTLDATEDDSTAAWHQAGAHLSFQLKHLEDGDRSIFLQQAVPRTIVAHAGGPGTLLPPKRGRKPNPRGVFTSKDE